MDYLTQKYVKELFEYQDGELIWKSNRGKNQTKGKIAGSEKSHNYKRIRFNGRTHYAHRLIFLYHHGYLPNMIDHINGNKFDNRIENLRECNKSTNAINSCVSSRNTSGVKGVYFDKAISKWCATLTINGKNKFIGNFDDIELAELVVKEAREKYHGEFARHE